VEELATVKEKEGTTHSWRARDVGASAALGTFAHTEWKKDGCGTPGLVLHNLRESLWMNSLKEEVRGGLESSHRENQITRKEGEADYRHHKHNLQRSENGALFEYH
jgi:hypothetical protein